MIKAIEHIAVVAADPTLLARWYCDTLGFEIAHAHEEHRTYFLRLPEGGILEILPSNDRVPVDHAGDDAGIRHIALVVENFNTAHQALEDRGVTFVGPSHTSPTGTRFDFFPDLEGNLLQLVYRPEPL